MKRSQVNERLEDINDRAEAYESDAARRKRNWPYTYAPEAERPFQFRSHTITSLGDGAVRCDARWVRGNVGEAARRRRGPGGVPREDVVRLTRPTVRRAQSLVAARDRSFQSLPCFCQFIRMCRFCGVFLPSVNSCSPTKLKRTMAAGPTTRIVGSLYSSEVHL